MTVRNKEDWIALAKETIPYLPEYMNSMRNMDEVKVEARLNELLAAEDWRGLATLFSDMWWALPDEGYIRGHPFSKLCDLCSESWALDE